MHRTDCLNNIFHFRLINVILSNYEVLAVIQLKSNEIYFFLTKCIIICYLAIFCVLLPCLQTIRVLDQDSPTVIGRTRHVTSPIWSRIDWLTGPKIRIVGLSFAELEIDKTVYLEFYLLLSGRSKHQFQ